MSPRRITVEEAIGIVDGAMVTRAVTDETRAAWVPIRGELRRRPRPSEAMRLVAAELARTSPHDPRVEPEDEVTRRERRRPSSASFRAATRVLREAADEGRKP